MKYFWITLGWISVVLGIIGAFLPLLPTTPFLLLAAWSFSQGSEKLHDWIMTHPKLSPPILDWQKYGAIKQRVKIIASLSMVAVFLLALAMAVPWWAITSQAVVLAGVGLFIWTRPQAPVDSTGAGETDVSQQS